MCMIDFYLHWHPSDGHVTSPSPEQLIGYHAGLIMKKSYHDDHDGFDNHVHVDDGDGVVDDDASKDLNIASNFELVSWRAFGGGGKAREAP